MVFAPKGAMEGTVTKLAVEVTPGSEGGLLVVSDLPSGSEVVAAGGAALKQDQKVRRFIRLDN